jgi:hypothetical protein
MISLLNYLAETSSNKARGCLCPNSFLIYLMISYLSDSSKNEPSWEITALTNLS